MDMLLEGLSIVFAIVELFAVSGAGLELRRLVLYPDLELKLELELSGFRLAGE